ncbi:MAG: ubiquinone-binding protein [marine bacterium B5-7]|nr:MAG: ubiquinone-binding protein [marine bacterium B5-7]
MTKINKQAQVTYSAHQMFSLVCDVESYPDFLPWCTDTNILESKDNFTVASVSIAIGKLKQTFTTANTIQTDTSVIMRLVKGPFKELYGNWQFLESENGGCQVLLEMEFEFKNKLLKHALGAAFKKITDSLVDAFIKRARDVYG